VVEVVVVGRGVGGGGSFDSGVSVAGSWCWLVVMIVVGKTPSKKQHNRGGASRMTQQARTHAYRCGEWRMASTMGAISVCVLGCEVVCVCVYGSVLQSPPTQRRLRARTHTHINARTHTHTHTQAYPHTSTHIQIQYIQEKTTTTKRTLSRSSKSSFVTL
jgi:hypothetical protein